MDDIATKPAERLYEDDFYAWTQAQSALLRSGRLDEADIANILEEIESLGRAQVADIYALLKGLAHHLLKEIYHPEKASRSWAVTIVLQRQEFEHHIQDSPSLEPKTPEIFARAYADARKLAAIETDIPLTTFPEQPPFTYAQATDEAFWPGRSVDDRS